MYRALLTEGVSLRDIVTIATVLVASSTVDERSYSAGGRCAPGIAAQHYPFRSFRKQELTVYTLNNELENLLTNVVNQAQQGGKVMLDSVAGRSEYAQPVQSTMPQVKEQMKAAGKDPVAAGATAAAPFCWRVMQGCLRRGCIVLSYNEVPDELELKIMGALM
ncbi:flagellar system protein [Escherichia coli]|uniref:Flagellar system protein n=1 Tax=Escherichia coli TaxID=562 RepID=A0A377DWW4_ECOLX|nr:flagellar system protein [Escherichia coli]